MGIKQDLTGRRFGRLLVIGESDERSPQNRTLWICQCDCGNVVLHVSDELLKGNTTSCGCKWLDNAKRAQDAVASDYTVDGVRVPSLTGRIAKSNTSGVKGVTKRNVRGKEKYYAYITFNGKQHSLGLYNTLDEAAEARRQGELKYHQPYIDKLASEKNKKEATS